MFRRLFSSHSAISRPRRNFKLSDLKVIYEDNHLLVLNKPSGMLSQPGLSRDELLNPFRTKKEDEDPEDLISHAAHYIKVKYDKPGNVFVAAVNRLDRPVSGLIVCAKTSKAASRLASEFSARRVEKEYVAVVDGELIGHGKVEAGLTSYDTHWKERGGLRYQRAIDVGKGKKHDKMDGELKWAALHHHVMPDGSMKTLVGIKTKTGYKHQIRRQMAYLGHPITADTLYGRKNRQEKQLLFPDQDKICLHASFMKIRHPVKDRKPISFVASLSKSFFPWMEFDKSRQHYYDIEEAERAAAVREIMRNHSHV